MLTDVVGYAVAIAAVEIGTWSATKTYNFGFARVELIGALISLFLTCEYNRNLVFGLIQEALHRIDEPQEINALAMLISALFGVGANSFMAFMLQDPHHDYDHHHHHSLSSSPSSEEDSILEMKQPSSPQFNADTATLCNPESDIESGSTNNVNKSIHQNINVQAAMIHIIGDLLGSISILLAALLLLFKPTWTILDPLCTILFSIIIFISSLGLAKQYILILMETCPEDIDVEDVRNGVLALEGVEAVDGVRCWSLTAG
ncbi:UNVERIFIED_CONTAM: hypothetical protein HDU68_009785 [Siphonaria sp. JEL0065]|nr:hypothetical protein HDU68_009785 [Siphonaria sp. JEL0065]